MSVSGSTVIEIKQQVLADPVGEMLLDPGEARQHHRAASFARREERVDHDDLALQQVGIQPPAFAVLVDQLDVREVLLGRRRLGGHRRRPARVTVRITLLLRSSKSDFAAASTRVVHSRDHLGEPLGRRQPVHASPFPDCGRHPRG